MEWIQPVKDKETDDLTLDLVGGKRQFDAQLKRATNSQKCIQVPTPQGTSTSWSLLQRFRKPRTAPNVLETLPAPVTSWWSRAIQRTRGWGHGTSLAYRHSADWKQASQSLQMVFALRKTVPLGTSPWFASSTRLLLLDASISAQIKSYSRIFYDPESSIRNWSTKTLEIRMKQTQEIWMSINTDEMESMEHCRGHGYGRVWNQTHDQKQYKN